MKGGSGAHTIGQCGRSPHNVWTSQTVAVRPDLLFLVHLRLRIEECDVSDSVSLRGPGRKERCYRVRVLLSVRRIVGIIEGRVEHRSRVRSVEQIGDKHGVSLGSNAPAEITNHWT